MYSLRKLYHSVLYDNLTSHHYTILQSIYRFINHLIRLALFITLSYTVDASLGIVFVLFLLDTLSNQSIMTLLCSFVLLGSRLVGGLFYVVLICWFYCIEYWEGDCFVGYSRFIWYNSSFISSYSFQLCYIYSCGYFCTCLLSLYSHLLS